PSPQRNGFMRRTSPLLSSRGTRGAVTPAPRGCFIGEAAVRRRGQRGEIRPLPDKGSRVSADAYAHRAGNRDLPLKRDVSRCVDSTQPGAWSAFATYACVSAAHVGAMAERYVQGGTVV